MAWVHDMQFHLLKNRNFRLYVSGQTISLFGNVLLTVSLSLYVLSLTGSTTQFANVWIMSAIPHILIGPFAGVWVDRLPQKGLLVFCDLFRACYLALGCYLSFTNRCSLNFIYVSLFLFGVVAVFFRGGLAGVLPSILRREEITSGNALRSFMEQLGEVTAPVLSTLLYHSCGLSLLFGIASVTFFISGATKLFLTLPRRRRHRETSPFWTELWSGFSLLWRDRRIGSLTLNSCLTTIFITPFFTIGTLHILIQVLHVSETYVGTVRSSAVIGSLFPIVLVGWIQNRFSLSRNVTVGLFGVLCSTTLLFWFLLPAVEHILGRYPLGATSFFSGARFSFEMMVGLYGIFVTSFYQLHVHVDDLGKYTSILRMFQRIGQIAGLSLYGHLFEFRPLREAFLCLLIGLFLKTVVHIPFLFPGAGKRKRDVRKTMEVHG